MKRPAKFPLYKLVLVDSTPTHDFYIKKCDREWYVHAFPAGTQDYDRQTLAGFSTLRVALECIEAWKGWLR